MLHVLSLVQTSIGFGNPCRTGRLMCHMRSICVSSNLVWFSNNVFQREVGVSLLDYHIKEGLVLILVNVQWAHDQLCKAVQGLQGECHEMQPKC